jgi:hypothetical protein
MTPALGYCSGSGWGSVGQESRTPNVIAKEAPPVPLAPFTCCFVRFDRIQAVREVFGDEMEDALRSLKVSFT